MVDETEDIINVMLRKTFVTTVFGCKHSSNLVGGATLKSLAFVR